MDEQPTGRPAESPAAEAGPPLPTPAAPAPTATARGRARRVRPERMLSRRTVLTAAAAGGAGVAAARLFAGPTVERVPITVTGGMANAKGLDWVSPLDQEPAKVAHLLRRATFGYDQAALDKASAEGYARTVERLLEEPAEPAALKGADDANTLPGQNLKVNEVQVWWLDWMLASPTPFAERMTLYWHSHFTSDIRKVGAQTPYIYWQNQTWRKFSLGNLRSMLYQVTVDPAMLVYLDLAQSTGRNPNENYARELMELFTMGNGTFTEDDVKNGSKALSGWRPPRTQKMIEAQIEEAKMRNRTVPPQLASAKGDTTKTGIFERNRSFTGGGIPFLGTTRAWDTEAVIDQILKQDATAPFLVRELVTHFATPAPSEEFVARLAASFRKSGYDVRGLMRDIFTSPEFVAPTAYRSLIKSPIELMVGTAKALGNPALTRTISGSGQAMGQTLFDPPSVGGWPQNESWVSSNAMLSRANFVTAAVQQTRRLPPADRAHATYLDSVLSPQTLKLLNEAGDERRRWTLLLTSPEFQLK